MHTLLKGMTGRLSNENLRRLWELTAQSSPVNVQSREGIVQQNVSVESRPMLHQETTRVDVRKSTKEIVDEIVDERTAKILDGSSSEAVSTQIQALAFAIKRAANMYRFGLKKQALQAVANSILVISAYTEDDTRDGYS